MNILFIHDAFPAQFGRACARAFASAKMALSIPGAESLELPDSLTGDAQGAGDSHGAEIGRASHLGRHSLAADLRALPRSVPDDPRHDQGDAALATRSGRRPWRSRRSDVVPARGARMPDHHLLRILFRQQSSRHLVPDRPAAGRARAVFSALHQRADAGDPGRLRRRLFGHSSGRRRRFPRGSITRSKSTSTVSTPSCTHRGSVHARLAIGRFRRVQRL